MASVKAGIEEKPKVDVQQAAQAAATYFKKLFGDVKGFSLEEVERSEDGQFWMITLSYDAPKNRLEAGAKFLPPRTKFKVFKVDTQSGEVVAMKIRSLA